MEFINTVSILETTFLISVFINVKKINIYFYKLSRKGILQNAVSKLETTSDKRRFYCIFKK